MKIDSERPDAARELLTQLRQYAHRRSTEIAIRTELPRSSKSLTWYELYGATANAAARASAALADSGPVILAVDNSPGCVAVMAGLICAGCDVLLLEHENSFMTDRNSVIQAIKARHIVGPAATATSDFSPMLRYWTYDEIIASEARPPAPAERSSTPCPEPAILQVTSGSTGEPKIVRRPIAAVVRSGELYRDAFKVTQADELLVCVPFAHSFGLTGGLMSALTSGASLVTFAPFSLPAVLEELQADRVSVVLGTPLVYELLISSRWPGRAHHSPRVLVSCGGPLALNVAAKAVQYLGRPISQVYGSTETGIIACQFEGGGPWPGGCVGRAVPGVRWRIEPESDGEARPNVGRFMVSTSTMFAGYVPASDSRAPGDFYDTGDVVRVDRDGNIFIIGRKATFINIGGRKVNPRRIERLLAAYCQGVREVFVYGQESPGDKEEIHAAVVLEDDVAGDDLLEGCRPHLMPYEVPRHVHILPRLPRTGMGKPDTREIVRLVARGEAT